MLSHLIFDGDDTLWEDSIYFKDATTEFIKYVNHPSLLPDEILSIIKEIEFHNTKIHGYGIAIFVKNLLECYEHLTNQIECNEALKWLTDLGDRILNHPIQLIDGVKETLDYLSSRHDLILFTKGDIEQQEIKICRSGLLPYFRSVSIVKEKSIEAYSELIENKNLNRDATWMIGNSPRSDINPAIKAGINTIYIPHSETWHVEAQEINNTTGKLLILKKFSCLCNYF
jgi:putative hydrolase of the HAD superfamily